MNNGEPWLPLQTHPPEQRQYRQLLAKFFRGERISSLEPQIAAVANKLIGMFPVHAQAESQ